MTQDNELTPEQAQQELEAALTDAENAIVDSNTGGYSGFCSDQWYCVEHALTHIWKSDLKAIEAVVKFCTTGQGDLLDLDGHSVNAWHEDSVQYLQSSKDYAEGIYCAVEDCQAEIYPAADDGGEDDSEFDLVEILDANEIHETSKED